MSDLNLLRYYARLEPLGVGEDIKTALPDIAERLFTSHRHARNLLNQMQQRVAIMGPQSGKASRSTLVLNLTLPDLKSQLASKRIRQGQYEQALKHSR